MTNEVLNDWKLFIARVHLRAQSDPSFAHELKHDARALLGVSPYFTELTSAQIFDFLKDLRAYGVLTPNFLAPHVLTSNGLGPDNIVKKH